MKKNLLIILLFIPLTAYNQQSFLLKLSYSCNSDKIYDKFITKWQKETHIDSFFKYNNEFDGLVKCIYKIPQQELNKSKYIVSTENIIVKKADNDFDFQFVVDTLKSIDELEWPSYYDFYIKDSKTDFSQRVVSEFYEIKVHFNSYSYITKINDYKLLDSCNNLLYINNKYRKIFHKFFNVTKFRSKNDFYNKKKFIIARIKNFENCRLEYFIRQIVLSSSEKFAIVEWAGCRCEGYDLYYFNGDIWIYIGVMAETC